MTGPVQLHLCPQCDEVTCPSAATAVSIASAAAQPLTTPPPHCNCRAQFSLVITGYQQIRPDHRVQAHLLRLVRVQNPEPRGHVPALRRISVRPTPPSSSIGGALVQCHRHRSFENPPGSTKSKPIVDYFSLDQDMYICDAVKSGRTERRCGRGFLSESNKQSCTHEVRAFRSRLNSDPSKQPRSGGVGTGRSGGLRQAHERLGPRNQPYPHDGFAQRQQDLSVGGENRRAVIGSFREQAREMQGGYRDPGRFMVQRGGPVDPRGGGGSYRDDSLFRDRYGSAGGPGYDDRAVRWDGGAATAAARPRQSMPWDARDPSTPRDPPTREVRYY